MGKHWSRHIKSVVWIMLMLALSLSVSSTAYCMIDPNQPITERPAYKPDEVIVTLSAGKTEADLADLCAAYGCEIRARIPSMNAYCLQLSGTNSPANRFMADKSSILKRFPAIRDIQRNHLFYRCAVPNDEYYAPSGTSWFYQWPLQEDAITGLKHIYAPEAWDIEKGSDKVIVAVLDSGIRERYKYNEKGGVIRIPHPDLANRLISGVDVADSLMDPDTEEENRGPAPTEEEASRFSGAWSHGTIVGGIIGAETDNNIGMAGLCWEGVNILPVKIFTDKNDYCDEMILADALSWCTSVRYSDSSTGQSYPVSVINLSIGAPYAGPILAGAIRLAAKKGIAVVAAAGNEWDMGPYPPNYPAGYEDAICVGATDASDKISYFSNRGRSVDLVAPGEMILSTSWSRLIAKEGVDKMDPPPSPVPAPAVGAWPDIYGNDFSLLGYGTSFAAPHVAAAAALLMSHGLPGSDVKRILCETATPIGIGQPNDTYGWGLINVEAALAKATIGVDIQSPSNGTEVPTSRPRIRIDFRHARRDSIRVYIDGVTVIGPGGTIPDWEKHFYVLDPSAGMTYLLFDYPVTTGSIMHTLRVEAESDYPFAVQPPQAPFREDDEVQFRVRPGGLSYGWHLFSIPYWYNPPETPQDILDNGILARWHYANGTTGQYAMYTTDLSRAENEASFTPNSVMENNLAYPISSTSLSTPPAGIGYWLFVSDPEGIEYPETSGVNLDNSPYVVGLYKGWNMVGDPFAFPVQWSNVLVEYGEERISVQEAIERGWISDFIFRYDNVYKKYTWRRANNAVLVPWEAEWVLVRVNGPDGWPNPDIKLIIPPNAYSGAIW